MAALTDVLVTLRLLSRRGGRPPLQQLRVEASLANRSPVALWFVLPTRLPVPPPGGVDVLESFALEGAGRAIVGRFLGTGGFQTLLLPPGGKLRAPLTISYWGETPPGPLEVELTVAKGLMIGETPASVWFSDDPTCDAWVDAPDGVERMVASRRSATGAELPVAFDGALTLRVVLEL
jgi:hypothetical protein